MPRSAGWIAILAAAVVVLFAAAGCGGGGSPAKPAPAPEPQGTATVTGVVVDAANVQQVIPYAAVSIDPPGLAIQAGGDGTFVVRNLPVGILQLHVDPGPNPGYTSTLLNIETADNAITRVVVTLVPLKAGLPDRVVIQPAEVTMDVGSQQQFTATVWSGAVQLNISPSWVVEGNIGTIDAAGNFTATDPGQGKVVAVAGQKRAEAAVTVTGPVPPRIWSVFVDPNTLPSNGGQATFTVHASDGDGIDVVRATIYKPDGAQDTILLQRVAGTEKDGTWRGNYDFPRNTAAIDPSGHQPAQVYDVRIKVVDSSGAQTLSGFYQVTVLGVDAPPPPGP